MSEDVVSRAASVPANSPLRAAMDGRANIFEMTEAVHGAALTPADPGGLSHALRAAIAERMARLHHDVPLVAHYRSLLEPGATPALIAVAEGGAGEDARTDALLTYVDKAGGAPREIVAADIEALQTAGIDDADIVRLAELIAFLAYQLRVVAALRLMGDAK